MTSQKHKLFMFVLFSMAVIGLASQGGSANVVIDADKKNIDRKPDQPFDPNNPPPGAKPGANGYTSFRATWSCRPEFTSTKVPGSYCTIEVTVTKVTVKIGLEITVFLPPAPGPGATAEEKARFATLKAHEEGHATIAQEVFQIVAKKIAQDVYKGFPAKFTLDVDPCTDEEIKKRINAALATYCKDLGDKVTSKIEAEIQKASDAYDTQTQDGTQDSGGGPPTADGQGAAAKDAVKEFKKNFEKP